MGAPDGIGTSPLRRRAPQSYADVQREADALGEAIGLSAELGADSWLRADLLERLLRLERRLARRASAPYRYWQLRPSGERSPLATALAEVYLETGQFAKAIDWARHGYRPDLEARAMLASGDVGGALTALERLVWADWGPPSKRVGRVYAAALLSAIDESDPSASMRTFPHLTKALLATFGSWATLEFEAVQGHPRAEPWLPACAPRAVQASEYAGALALGEERLKARREREAQLARCYSLARRGRFAEAEESARSLFDPSRSDRFEIETLITEILVATEQYAEAIERLTSRYLRGSHEKDLLFNLKLALDIEITGADLVRNFYFFIEPRSLLFDRLHDRYIEEAALSLAEFVLASGTDPFRRFVHEAQGRDVLYTWAHHGPRVAHGSRARQLWKRFPPWYCSRGTRSLKLGYERSFPTWKRACAPGSESLRSLSGGRMSRRSS